MMMEKIISHCRIMRKLAIGIDWFSRHIVLFSTVAKDLPYVYEKDRYNEVSMRECPTGSL